MNIWFAQMETERYSWGAFGKTKEKALAALLKKWLDNPYTDHDYDTIEKLNEYYGVNCNSYKMGEGFQN